MTYDEIAEFYRSYLGITNERSVKTLVENTKLVHFKKGDNILVPGQSMLYVYFHLKGFTRGYLVSETGEEQTFAFGKKQYGEPCLGAGALDNAVRNYVQCMTDVDALRLSISALQQVLQNDRTVAAIYEQMILAESDRFFDIRVQLGHKSGREKYEWFLEEFANEVDDIPQIYIASCLGMKPQSLSRIKVAMEKEAAQNID